MQHETPFLLLAALAAASPATALADGPACGQHEDILAQLKAGYAEVVTKRGLSQRGYMFELTESADGGWTVVLTTPDGRSCAMDAGKAMETIPLPAKGSTS